MVDPIVRVHSHFPFVAIFSLDIIRELLISPRRYASQEANRILGASPNIASYEDCPSQNDAAGNNCPIHIAKTANRLSKNPSPITDLVALNP